MTESSPPRIDLPSALAGGAVPPAPRRSFPPRDANDADVDVPASPVVDPSSPATAPRGCDRCPSSFNDIGENEKDPSGGAFLWK